MPELLGNIGVLLTGPSRGFVKQGLTSMNIPFWHLNVPSKYLLPSLYKSLDLYIICSRFEGGPKSFLEACSCGIPVVSTPVGQVSDIYRTSPLLSKSFSYQELSSLMIKVISYSKIQFSTYSNYVRQLALDYDSNRQLPSGVLTYSSFSNFYP